MRASRDPAPPSIGLLVGREWSFPPALIAEIQRLEPAIPVDYIRLGALGPDDPMSHTVVLDRISYAVPFYRAFLKRAASRGVAVVNDPFRTSVVDRFLASGAAAALGIPVPRTVMLPHHDYGAGIVPEESLRNLDYPLDWEAIAGRVGMPCVLREARGTASDPRICHDLGELLHHYDRSGRSLLLAEEWIDSDRRVRSFVVGDEVLSVQYDAREEKVRLDHEHLGVEEGRLVHEQSLAITRELGLAFNAIDWVIRDGVPFGIDLVNPVPEVDVYAIPQHYFDWLVSEVAGLLIRAARSSAEPQRGVRSRSL